MTTTRAPGANDHTVCDWDDDHTPGPDRPCNVCGAPTPEREGTCPNGHAADTGRRSAVAFIEGSSA